MHWLILPMHFSFNQQYPLHSMDKLEPFKSLYHRAAERKGGTRALELLLSQL